MVKTFIDCILMAVFCYCLLCCYGIIGMLSKNDFFKLYLHNALFDFFNTLYVGVLSESGF